VQERKRSQLFQVFCFATLRIPVCSFPDVLDLEWVSKAVGLPEPA